MGVHALLERSESPQEYLSSHGPASERLLPVRQGRGVNAPRPTGGRSKPCLSEQGRDRQTGRRAEEGAAYRMRADQQTCWCACSLTQERGQCWPPISPLSWKADQKGEADDHAQAATPPRDLPT